MYYRSLTASVLVFMMLLVSFGASATALNGDSYKASHELMNVKMYDVVRLDASDISKKANLGCDIGLSINGIYVSFSLVPADVGYCSEEVRTYKGVDLAGIQLVRVTLAHSWIHIFVMLDGKDFFIDPVDGTGESGYYAVYSYEKTYEDPSGSPMCSVSEAADSLGHVVADSDGSTGSFAGTNQFSNESSTSQPVPTVPAQECLSVSNTVSGFKPESPRNVTRSCEGNDPVYRIAKIILASDVEFRNRYPTDWIARMYSTINDLNAKYETQVGITFEVATTVAIPSTECTATDANTLLNNFAGWMTRDPGIMNFPRNVSHLFTGKDLDGNTVGTSWEAGVGTRSWWMSGTPPWDLDEAYSLSQQWGSSAGNLWLIGHELGHNFNGDHNYRDSVNGHPSWMSPTDNDAVAVFSPKEVARITSWGEQTLGEVKMFNPGPSSVSQQHLQSGNLFQKGAYLYWVGTSAKVGFYIKNVGSSSLTLNWLFVGARDSFGNNRDFGHIFNIVLSAGATYQYETTYTPQVGNAWTLWPAYKIGTRYGPYEWLTITPVMYYKQNSWRGLATSSDNVDLFYRFNILTTNQIPTVGSAVYVYVTMYNGHGLTPPTYDTFGNFFIGCRWSRLSDLYNRDFGYSGSKTLSQLGDSLETGQGWFLFESRILDASGTWYFWPAYQYQGHWGPWAWNILAINVT